MWNVTTYECKLKISWLECETYLSCNENGLGSAQTIGSVGLVETYIFYVRTTSYIENIN